MIGMVMSNKYVAEAVKCNAGSYQLPRRTVATIDDVWNVVDEDQRCRIAAAFGDTWSTFRPQENYPRRLVVLTESITTENGKAGGGNKKLSARGLHTRQITPIT